MHIIFARLVDVGNLFTFSLNKERIITFKIPNAAFFFHYLSINNKKSKAVPLHAMEADGGRGGIAPAHSQPQH
jgi:hypothetical protein